MTAGRRGRGWLSKGHMRQHDPGSGPPALGADRDAFLWWEALCPFPGPGSFASQTITRLMSGACGFRAGGWSWSPKFFLWVRVRPLQEPCPAAPHGESCGEDRCPLNLQIWASLAEHMPFSVLLSLSFWASVAEQCLFKLVKSPFKRHFAVSLGAHLCGRGTFNPCSRDRCLNRHL